MHLLTISSSESNVYCPRLETPDQMRSSFFADVYQDAQQNVQEILRQFDNMPDALAECSNILAFTGGRGAGKTSAMLNTARLLESGQTMEGGSWLSCSFVCLPTIDPTHLSADETVIDIVLARMYRKFEDHCKKTNVPMETRRALYQAFHEAYVAVRALCQSREIRHNASDSVEGLQNAVAGNNLRNLLYELVQKFLKALFSENIDGCLVLCVDDVDMNIQQGYDICEELRKYLNIPHVIVMFSLCMDQMNDMVRQQYLENFDVLLRHGEEQTLSESISNMSEKYLQKFIPFGHRCALPSIEPQNLCKVMVQYETPSGTVTSEQKPLVNEILSLLYQKTGLILIVDQANSHAFLPNTLRGIIHLLVLLRKMESVEIIKEEPGLDGSYYDLSSEESAVLQKNLDTITRYIQEYLIFTFPQGSAKILQLLQKEAEGRLNQYVVRTMLREMEQQPWDFRVDEQGLSEFLSDKLPPENVSLGDVLYVMRKYSQTVHYYDGLGPCFSALFKILYSIRILQLFYENSQISFSQRKNRLFVLLGGLIHNPEKDNLVRINWENLKKLQKQHIRNVKGLEKDGCTSLIEALAIGTYCCGDGQPNSKAGETFRSRNTDPFYEDVSCSTISGAMGNTYQYFAYSYCGCILNSLRSDLGIQNLEYLQWQKRHLSPLPILSVDCIDAYVTGLYQATKNYCKNSSLTLSVIISNGTRKLIENLLAHSAIGKTACAILDEALKTFPYLREDTALDEYLLNSTDEANDYRSQ